MKSSPPRFVHTGFTLVEMVVSLAVIGVLMAGMTSAVVLASHALPRSTSAASAVVDTSRALHTFRDELSAATRITSTSTNHVTFTLPDRDGDGNPEVVTYQWAGASGDPLTRRLNASSAAAVLDNVQSFTIGFSVSPYTETFAGVPTQSAEQLLSSWDHADIDVDDRENHTLKSNDWAAAKITPTLPAGATDYTVTRLLVYGRKSGDNGATYQVQVRPIDNNKPSATIIESVDLLERDLDNTYRWIEAVFSTAGPFAVGDDFALVLAHVTGGPAGRFAYDNAASGNENMYTSSDDGLNWSSDDGDDDDDDDGDRLVHFAYGTYSTPADDWGLTRQRANAANLTLVHGDATATTHRLRVPMHNAPSLYDNLWEADFNGDPAALDLNHDGNVEWESAAVFDNFSLVNGQWIASTPLTGLPNTPAFDTPATIDLWLTDTTDNASGGGLRLRVDRNGTTQGHLVFHLQLVGDEQKITVSFETPSGDLDDKITVDRPADGVVHLHATIDPATDTVAVVIDGEDAGSFTYDTISDNADVGLRLFTDSSSSGLLIDHARIATGGTITYTPAN